MGAASRMGRSGRFVEEFRKDILKAAVPPEGARLEVQAISLSLDEDADAVRVFMVLREADGGPAGGRTWEVAITDLPVLFRPDDDDPGEVAERLGSLLHVDEDEIMRRLRKADLADD